MNNYFGNSNNTNVHSSNQAAGAMSKTFLSNVFAFMGGGLLLTAVIAWVFGTNLELFYEYIINSETGRPTPLYWIAAFSPLVLMLVMGFAFEKLPMAALLGIFIAITVLMGVSLSTLLMGYGVAMVAKAFFISAGTFAVMAVVGYTTNADLSKFKTIISITFMIALVVMLINVFLMKSSGLALVLDLIFLAVFVGMIAYKMQDIRRIGETVGGSQPKLALMAALSLYITFINLFITILRLMGRRN